MAMRPEFVRIAMDDPVTVVEGHCGVTTMVRLRQQTLRLRLRVENDPSDVVRMRSGIFVLCYRSENPFRGHALAGADAQYKGGQLEAVQAAVITPPAPGQDECQ